MNLLLCEPGAVYEVSLDQVRLGQFRFVWMSLDYFMSQVRTRHNKGAHTAEGLQLPTTLRISCDYYDSTEILWQDCDDGAYGDDDCGDIGSHYSCMRQMDQKMWKIVYW